MDNITYITKPNGIRLTDEEGWVLEAKETSAFTAFTLTTKDGPSPRFLAATEEREALGHWLLRTNPVPSFIAGLRAALDAVQKVDGPTSWAVEHIQELIDTAHLDAQYCPDCKHPWSYARDGECSMPVIPGTHIPISRSDARRTKCACTSVQAE